jgi:2-hydroxychromene-2-carboxylate isomerase
MSQPVEFWFEFASTYSYPAALQVEAACQRQQVPLVWRPFLLGPIFREQGWNDSPFNLYPAKGRYMWRDLERLCAAAHIPFRRPSVFPRNGLLAARIACVAEGADWLPEYVRRVYAANFEHDLDIADADVLLRCLQGLTADAQAMLQAANEAAAKLKLRQNTERAMQLGIFGAPTFVVGEEVFWGGDRLGMALDWSRR